MRVSVCVLALVVPLAACVGPPGERSSAANPPVSVQPVGSVPSNYIPEAANSLPPGAQVVAPLTSPVGTLNSVRVGPPTR